jgi:hypothetical protein
MIDFFIIGAPKCGTTSLASYLSEHPSIGMSIPKEPHYFSTDFPHHRNTDDFQTYLRFFEEDKKLKGEASVWYLVSDNAVQNIITYNPAAKFIIMLRNPLTMLPSLHAQLLYNSDERIGSFTAAWNYSDYRRMGKKLPRTCRQSVILDYKNIAKYDKQIIRVFKLVPREQVLIIEFEEFVQNTQAQFFRILKFLGLEAIDLKEVIVKNPRKKHRSHLLGYFLMNKPRWMETTWAFLKKHIKVGALGDYLLRVNTVDEHPRKIDDLIKQQILTEYSETVSWCRVNLGIGYRWKEFHS